MKIIVPCAGRSSRFPNMLPKWMLPDNDGLPMVYKAIRGLNAPVEDLVVTILAEHQQRFNAIEGLKRAFGQPVHCVVLDEPTSSQSETVVETLRRAGIDEPFIVKDSDNYFELGTIEERYNYVSVASLEDFDQVNPQNKSYVQVDQEDIIINFREKKVISDLFSVGGYFFTDPKAFLAAYDEMLRGTRLAGGELYLSEIIAFMALNGHIFKARKAKKYDDWGTVTEWRRRLEKQRVYLVSVDGFLFQRGSLYFEPYFDKVTPNATAVEAVRKMTASGHTVRYVSIRPSHLEALTRAQIQAQLLPEAPILFDCDVAQWALLTAPHPTLPFKTSEAIEVDPSDPNLAERLGISG